MVGGGRNLIKRDVKSVETHFTLVGPRDPNHQRIGHHGAFATCKRVFRRFVENF